jgi:hypothetical protein
LIVLKADHNIFLGSFLLKYLERLSDVQKLKKTLVTLRTSSNVVIRNGFIRNKLVLKNHFLCPIANLLYKNKEQLTLRNNFKMTKKFLITKFDCTISTLIPYYIFSLVKFMFFKKAIDIDEIFTVDLTLCSQ